MKILCRVDSNAKIGIGHLMRCLALSQALAQENISVTFLINEETLQICEDRGDWVGEIMILPTLLTTEDEIDWLKSNIIINKYQAILLDGYQFNYHYRRSLKSLNILLFMFDDNNNSGLLYADLVINSVNNAEELDYKTTTSNAILCLGIKYTVLRREFTQLTLSPWEQRTDLTIIMGGSDPSDLTLPMIEVLQQQNSNMPINIITGSAYTKVKELEQFTNLTNLDIVHHDNCQQVAKVFSDSRLVISAAGSSQNELLACATPAFLVVVAENQLNSAQEAKAKCVCEVYNYLEYPDIDKLIEKALLLWQQEKLLKLMHHNSTGLRNISGANRVVDKIIQVLN